MEGSPVAEQPLKEKIKIEEEQEKTKEVTENLLENDFVDDKRLFVMNLSYTVTKEEI